MYEKKEVFDFIVRTVAVRLSLVFKLDEDKAMLEFRKNCALLNNPPEDKKNNCELSIGEITHLASIFLYESVKELLNEQPNILPPQSAFDNEETNIFEITLNITFERETWSYEGVSSTFCNVLIYVMAIDIFEALPSALKNNIIINTAQHTSPLRVYSSLVHEFSHHCDHTAFAKRKVLRLRYEKITKKTLKEHLDENNGMFMAYTLFMAIRDEAIGQFCENYAAQSLRLHKSEDLMLSRNSLISFSEDLSRKTWDALISWRYSIGYDMCMMIALAEHKKFAPTVDVVCIHPEKVVITGGSKQKKPERLLVADLIKKDFIENAEDHFIILPRKIFDSVQKKILATKNFAEFLLLYELSCNELNVPVKFRFLTLDLYITLKKKIREKTLAMREANNKSLFTKIFTIFEKIKKLF